MRFSEFTFAQARALAEAPSLRLLRHLDLDAESADKSIAALARCPYLGNVRELVLYVWRGSAPLEALVARMGRLGDLNVVGEGLDPAPAVALPLPHLTELRIGEVARYPVREIAANASLGRLETLTLTPALRHYDTPAGLGFEDVQALARSPHLTSLRWLTIHRSDMGDEGIGELIDSGLIDRLESLDLAHGCITDVGARALAGCRGAKRLYSLNLVGNQLTEAGLRALRRLKKVQVEAYGQRAPGEDYRYSDDDEDLHDDDWE
jgi:hypothetical protein